MGKFKKSLPPLDDAGEMVTWWAAHMTNRVPDEIWAAAQVPVEMPVEVVIGLPEKQDEAAVDVGLEAELLALEQLAARLRVGAHEPGKVKGYLDTVARLGTLSEKLRSEAERMKRLLPRDQVESIIHEFHGPIEREVRLLYRTLCELMGLPSSPEREAQWNAEVDKLFIKMGEEIFRIS